MPYLTPNTLPAQFQCRSLFFPATVEWAAIVQGALLELTYAHNFEQYGAITPEECAAVFSDMSDRFAYDQGVCRVVGELILYAGATSPDSRWLLCDGSSLVRADYPDLFSVIGTLYGAADSLHFNLPDLQDRVPMGVGGNTLATQIGEATHTLTSAEMPVHSHSEVIATPFVADITTPTAPVAQVGAGVTGTAGGGAAHNNIQPSLVLNYFIVAAT